MSLAASLILLACRKGDVVEPKLTPVIDITQRALAPNTDESGTVRAYIGTQVTAEGINLDKVGAVKMDGNDAKIVEKGITRFVFEIPALELGQQDEPYAVMLEVFDADCETVIFTHPYYVTVPVTEVRVSGFAPEAGSIGTVVSIEGRNLEQVTKVVIGGIEIAADNFSEHSAGVIKFAVPFIEGSGAATACDIKVLWAQTETPVSTEEKKFAFNRSMVNTYEQSAVNKIGDEITLTGTNLDLVSAYKWGTYELPVMDGATAESVTLKIPSSIEPATPAEVTNALVAVWGTQTLTVAEAFRIDTTPMGPAKPVFGDIGNADDRYPNLYLNHTAVVRGENMASVEAFEFDGIRVNVVEGSVTDVEAKVVIPNTISGTNAKDVSLKAIYDGGNEADFGIITVFPFYYTKGLKLGLGSNSKDTYHQNGRDYSFLLLNEGKVISAEQWVTGNIDPYAKGKTANEVISAKNVAAEGKETEYYSVQPYTMVTADSNGKIAFQNPTNSNTQLKSFRYPNNDAVASTFGTASVWFGVIKDEDKNARSRILDGNFTNILEYSKKAGSGAPAYAAAHDANGTTWSVNSVICVQYVKYNTTALKPGDMGDVIRHGYIIITAISATDPDFPDKAPTDSRSGFVEFDLYWSNPL